MCVCACRNKRQLQVKLGSALWHLVAHHVGTITFGSLLLPPLYFLRMLLRFVRKRITLSAAALPLTGGNSEGDGDGHGDGDGGGVVSRVCAKLVACMSRACSCCFWCSHRCLDFYTYLAYAFVGTSSSSSSSSFLSILSFIYSLILTFCL